MAEVNINLKCDLQHAVKVQYLDGNLFSQDAAANTINIEVTDNGAPATIGGTVSANVIRPDGGTVAVTGGTISGNIVSITLPAACYALVGMISVIVKLTSDSTETTIAALTAYVYQSSTDTVVDPGTVISSIQDLIDAIDTAVASIPADYSSLWTKLAPAFSSSTAYTAGQYVTYNSGLYRFTKAHAAGSWASGDVVAVNIGGELSDVKSAFIDNASLIDQTFHPIWENGSLDSSGAESSANAGIRLRTNFLYIGNLDYVEISCDSGYMTYYCYYDKDKVYKGGSDWSSSTTKIRQSLNAVYVRVVLRLSNNGSVSPTDGNYCSIVGKTKIVSALQKINTANKIKIQAKKTEFTETGKQIFNPNEAIYKGYYSENGWIDRNDMLGGYCLVDGMEYITFNSGGQRIWSAFLTANLEVISAQASLLPADTPLTVPDGAYYFYLASATDNIPYLIITEGQTPYRFTDYKQFVNAENLTVPSVIGKSIGHGLNLYNKQTAVYGYRYTYDTGVYVADSNGYYASDFIPVKAETVYGFYTMAAHVCYWDKHKDYLSGAIASTGFSTKTTPANCAYITISTQAPDWTILSEGSTQIEYEQYYEYLLYGKDESETFTTDYIYKTFNVPATNALSSLTKVNTACLKLPSSYQPKGNPTKLCIIVHGASKGISSSDSSDWTHNTPYNKIVTALNNAGFAVMDSNGYDDSKAAGHEHWGCPQALAGYIQAYDYFTEHYNLDKDVYIYGFSMGGLAALNLMTARPFPIKCGMIASPVISLYDQCVSGTAQSVNAYFLEAYGIASYDKTKLYGSDRYHDIVTVGSEEYVFNNLPPLYIAYGSTDTAVSNEIIQEYFTALYNANHLVRIQEYIGGHDISYGGNDTEISDIVKWFGYFK